LVSHILFLHLEPKGEMPTAVGRGGLMIKVHGFAPSLGSPAQKSRFWA